jgi:hypothetical protein
MNKNGTIRNPPRPKPESSRSEPALEKDRPEIAPGCVPLDGRREKRAPMTTPVCLAAAEELLFAERAITVNVSPHGARVVTKRRWQAEERPWLVSLSREFRVRARVIYCQPLTDGHFCVGLGFQLGSVTFGDQTWW